jgi:hypothetical protein
MYGIRIVVPFSRFTEMLTVEDCRRKAAQWLESAQAASDPKTIASMRRAADAWTRQAEQIEEVNLRRPRQPAPMKRPVDLSEPRNLHPRDTLHVGDVLRERLHLGDEDFDNSAQ